MLKWISSGSSVQSLSCVNTLQPHGLQHGRPPCPSSIPVVYSNLCPLSWRCHPTISSSVVPFSSCLQSFPASESFTMRQLFESGGQSIGVSASTSVLPMNSQEDYSFRMDSLDLPAVQGILKSLLRTPVQKHHFFSAQPSLWVQLSFPFMTTGKTSSFWLDRPLPAK